MLLGAHESTADGLSLAFSRGEADGVEAIQIFTKSNRMWRAKPLDPAEVARFHAEAARLGMRESTTVHASYLINLGAEEGELRRKSIEGLIDELRRCDALGAPFLVLHPGSHPEAARGVELVSAGIDEALSAHRGPCVLLLETAAGQGSALGRTFEELSAMREGAKHKDRVAYCFDTCHAFAAGYDLSTDAGYDATFAAFDRAAGLSLIKAFHLNDSKKPLDCRVDRHEHVTKGCIGELAFRRLVNDERFAQVPGFLEIPPEGNKECLDRLKALRQTARKASRRVAPSARAR